MLKRLFGAFVPSRSAESAIQDADAQQTPLDDGRTSYAQSGEDMIVDFIFRAIGVGQPTYLDVGAHHPTHLSNTHFFYSRGCHGVNVEPDPDLFQAFVTLRPDDINLNVGVGDGAQGCLPFHVMSTRTLNTFSATEAARYCESGLHRLERVVDVPVFSINTVIDEHFGGLAPDFVSIDVEGLDLEIVRSIDLKKYRPAVVCVETLTFSETRQETKVPEIAEYLRAQDYMVYADTYINTIFVDRVRWTNHQ